MKIFRLSPTGAPACLPDTALLIKQRPFFVPDFTQHCQAEVCIALRIERLGRSIAGEFARRYYDPSALTLAVTFTAVDLIEQLRTKGQPCDTAMGFDNAVAYAEGTPAVAPGSEVRANLDAHQQRLTVPDCILSTLDAQLSFVSYYYTLRQGDLLLYPLSDQPLGEVHIDQTLTLSVSEETAYRFHIK